MWTLVSNLMGDNFAYFFIGDAAFNHHCFLCILAAGSIRD